MFCKDCINLKNIDNSTYNQNLQLFEKDQLYLNDQLNDSTFYFCTQFVESLENSGIINSEDSIISMLRISLYINFYLIVGILLLFWYLKQSQTRFRNRFIEHEFELNSDDAKLENVDFKNSEQEFDKPVIRRKYSQYSDQSNESQESYKD